MIKKKGGALWIPQGAEHKMRILKSILALLLAMAMLIPLAACGGKEEDTTDAGDTTAAAAESGNETGEPATGTGDESGEVPTDEPATTPPETDERPTTGGEGTTTPVDPGTSGGATTTEPPKTTGPKPEVPTLEEGESWETIKVSSDVNIRRRTTSSLVAQPSPDGATVTMNKGDVYYIRMTIRDAFNSVTLPVSLKNGAAKVKLSLYPSAGNIDSSIAMGAVKSEESAAAAKMRLVLDDEVAVGIYYLAVECTSGSVGLYIAATGSSTLAYDKNEMSTGNRISVAAGRVRDYYAGNVDVLYQMTENTSSQMMSYIIKTNKDHYIIIDGGWEGKPAGGSGEGDAVALYDFMKAVCGDKIVIDAWIFTHIHTDHLGAFVEWSEKRFGTFTVKAFYHNLLDADYVHQYDDEYYEFAKRVHASLAKYDQNTVHIVKKGDVVQIDDIKIEFLRDGSTRYTNNVINNSSLVFKVTMGKSGQTVLFTGDLGDVASEETVRANPGGELKSDFVQMAHHGQSGATENFYKAVQPKACLWSTPKWLWDNNQGGGYNTGPWQTIIVRGWMEKLGVKHHFISYEHMNTIGFPYDLS